MELPSLVYAPAERLLNRGLRASLSAAAIARGLEGRSLDVRVDGLPLSLRVSIVTGEARVTAPGTTPASATVSGPPLAIARLLRGDREAAIRDGDVAISGDGAAAEAFRDLFRMAQPDLEEELSKLLGDPAAHQLGNLAREFTRWGSRAVDSVSRSVGEYLTEERRVLPTRAEAEAHYAQVDALAAGVDRAEARLRRLTGS